MTIKLKVCSKHSPLNFLPALELGLLVDELVLPHHGGRRLADAAVPALVPLVRRVDLQLVPVMEW